MPPKSGPRGEYIETETGNKISRRSQIHGTPNIILAGKSVVQSEVIIRGDLVRPGTTAPSSSSSTTTTTTTTTSASASGEKDPSKSQPPHHQHQQVSISLGRYVFIAPSCILRPPSRLVPNPNNPGHPPVLQHYPLRLESHITIGPNSIIQAASIGSHVQIGANCVLANMTILHSYIRILDNTHLPPGSVWPSFSVIAGRPARVVGEVGEGWGVLEGGPGGESRGLWRGVRTTAPGSGR